MTRLAYRNVATRWQTSQADAKRNAQESRAAVLRYPDLAAKLTQPPIGYARPEQWNGYVPAELYNDARNSSDRRTALFDLVLEALTRAEADSRVPHQEAS